MQPLNFGWISTAAVLGFAIAAVYAGRLHLPRSLYLALAGPFLYGFARWG